MVGDKTTGLMIYYYFVCRRKLWYSINGISMESENENVIIGKVLDETSYSNQRKHISINDEINLDFVKKKGEIHEIKKSKKIEEASIWQVKYYLFYLKKNGVNGITAKIDYPLLKTSIDVELKEEDEEEILKIIQNIKRIVNCKIPESPNASKKCKNCAYQDLCYI